jgi:DNA-binding NtrC family response regulator
LLHHFIQKKAREMKITVVPGIEPAALERLMRYAWPGNARELENAVERELIVSRGEVLSFRDFGTDSVLPPPGGASGGAGGDQGPLALDAVVARHIRAVLERCHGRVEGEHGAARLLDVHPSTLRKRMKKLGVSFGRMSVDKGTIFLDEIGELPPRA